MLDDALHESKFIRSLFLVSRANHLIFLFVYCFYLISFSCGWVFFYSFISFEYRAIQDQRMMTALSVLLGIPMDFAKPGKNSDPHYFCHQNSIK